MSTESRAGRVFAIIIVWAIILGLGFGAWKVYGFFQHKKQAADNAKVVDSTSSDSQCKYKIKVLADAFSGYCVLRSSEMKSQLRGYSIKLVIEDDKADYIGRIKALRSGDADMAVFTVDSLINASAKIGEFPGTIVMVIDETKGGDAIVAYKSAVKSIQDLNKPNAGFVLTPDSPSEFLARIVMADFNLPNLPEKCFTPADGAGDVYAKFKRASRTEPKAYVMWEPYVSKALEDPDVHVLIASDKLKGYIVDVLVARRQFLVDHPEQVKAVVESYFRASYSYNQSGMVNLVVEDSKTSEALSEGDADRLVKGIQWKNTLENYAHFNLLSRQEANNVDDMETIITKVSNVLVKTGAVSSEKINVAANTLYYDKIMADLRGSNFHPAQKLGLVQDATGTDDKVRGDVELPALSEAEWNNLLTVGQMRIESLSFLRGSSDLTIESRRSLEELATRLKSMPMYYLLVVGHARAEGDMDANMELAKNRADISAEQLILRYGVSRNRIRAVSAKPSGAGGEDQSVTFQLGQRPY